MFAGESRVDNGLTNNLKLEEQNTSIVLVLNLASEILNDGEGKITIRVQKSHYGLNESIPTKINITQHSSYENRIVLPLEGIFDYWSKSESLITCTEGVFLIGIIDNDRSVYLAETSTSYSRQMMICSIFICFEVKSVSDSA